MVVRQQGTAAMDAAETEGLDAVGMTKVSRQERVGPAVGDPLGLGWDGCCTWGGCRGEAAAL